MFAKKKQVVQINEGVVRFDNSGFGFVLDIINRYIEGVHSVNNKIT